MKRLASALVVWFLAVEALAAAEFFVAPDGEDANPGTQASPFATLERARDAVRALKKAQKLPADGVTVWLRGGVYRRDKAFELTDQDSGATQGPVVYRAYGQEVPHLVGGQSIAPSDCRPVSSAEVLQRLEPAARQHILEINLDTLGVGDVGKLPDRFQNGGGSPELFFDEQPMQLARWPNEGWVTIAQVIDRGVAPLDRSRGESERGVRGGTFVYTEDRPARWRVDDGVWLSGFWCHDWASECIRVASIDTDKRQMTLAAPHSYGLGPSSKWNTYPRRYYAMNVLEELEAPGEWYLDRQAKRLYFWPPKPLEGRRLMLSLLSTPLVSLKNTSHLTLRGLLFEVSRGGGVKMSGGTGNLVADCKFVNLADTAVSISGGTRNGVVSCDLWNLGRSGITLDGGDRKTLVPGEHFAVNNHVHHFARIQRTYAGGIHTHGVGNRVAHNLVHHTPHTAIFYGGNEHVIEFNEVHDLALETSDVGGFYTGRDWASRGNVVRYNYLHDLASMPGCGTMGVYLDDCDSGDQLIGNVFYKAGRAAFIGGGRDNLVANNIFVDCKSAVHLDVRGLQRAKPGTGVRDGWDLLAKAETLNFRQPPWSTRYPELARVMEEEPLLPRGNVIQRNLAVDCEKWLNTDGKTKDYLDRVKFQDNLVLTNEDPGFVDRHSKNFQLKDDSPVYQKIPGFQKIPFEKMGLYVDEYRTKLP